MFSYFCYGHGLFFMANGGRGKADCTSKSVTEVIYFNMYDIQVYIWDL